MYFYLTKKFYIFINAFVKLIRFNEKNKEEKKRKENKTVV